MNQRASTRTERADTRWVDVVRVAGANPLRLRDAIAREEPLEIRLHGARFVVTMRTPGADRDLAAGFLLAERLIGGPDDIGTMRYCTDADARDNVLDVTLSGAAADRVQATLAARRAVTTTSACGVCGRQSIDDLLRDLPQISSDWCVSGKLIGMLPRALRSAQSVFDETGGLHAAGLFDWDGTVIASAEDVGRHNAVDKVIGSRLLREQLPLNDRLLFVSGRTSFEIVQKAAMAGVSIVGAVSAPSSLAIDLARAANITLIGFVRGDTFNIYTGEERIRL
jgi:FdhD protein